jgi:carboxypeptidase T
MLTQQRSRRMGRQIHRTVCDPIGNRNRGKLIVAFVALFVFLTLGKAEVFAQVDEDNDHDLFLPLISNHGSGSQQATQDVVVRIYFATPEQLKRLRTQIDVWEEALSSQTYVTSLLSPQAIADLQAEGFQVEVDEAKTALLNRGPHLFGHAHQVEAIENNVIPNYTCYRTVEETYTSLAQLAASHPMMATWRDIGDSWEKVTAGGKPGYDMFALKLTNSASAGPKPALMIIAAIHAREYTTAELATRYAEHLLNNYGIDPDITWLLDYFEVHIIPQTNPDGRKIAETGNLWRKNTNPSNGCLGGTYGIDLNRNSSFQWGGTGSSADSCSETYRGPAPATEPEVQAIQNYVTALFPDRRGPNLTDVTPADAEGVFITLHSYGKFVLYPWGWITNPAPNNTQMATLGRKFGHFNDHKVCNDCLGYLANGTTDDWTYGELGIASYTFELGTTFFEQCNIFEEQVYSQNLPALIYAAKSVRRPYQTPSGPDTINLTLNAAVVGMDTPVNLAAVIDDTRYNSNGHGDEPTQAIQAGRYSFDAPSWTGATLYPLQAADGTFDSPSEGVAATINPAGLGVGKHLVFVEGQDADGNWGAPTAVFLEITTLTANANGPYTTEEGVDIPLDGSGSNDPGGATLSYEWDFNYDGITFDVDATGIMPSFTEMGQDGIITVALRVTNPGGAIDIDTATVTVKNVPPTVQIAPNDPEQEGSLVTVNGVVIDPGWLEALTATVDWGDGTPVEPISGVLENGRPDATLTVAPTHVYADNGAYTVTICGSDDETTVCTTSTISVNNVAPTVDAGADQIIYEGDTAILDPSTFNDKGTLDTHVATIDWGDGSVSDAGIVNESPFGPPGSINGASGTVASQHQYIGAPGIYTVTVTVTDKDGGVGADTLNITVVPGFFRFCAYADETKGDSSLSLIAKWATLDCARVPGGAPGKTRAGGVGGRSSLEAEDHALIQGDMVSLQGEIVLKGDSTLTGNIASLGDIELEDYAQAEGNVTTAGSILLKNHSVITGDANAGGDIQLQEQSVISGVINAFTTVPPLAQITPVQFSLSAGAQDVTVDKETQLALDPGSYRDVEIGTDATLTLRAGRYTFRQLETTRAAIVAFDLSDGPIVIDVVKNVELAEQTQMVIESATGDAADILFRVGGDQIYLAEEGIYLGTFLGLDTKAKLGQNATLTGAMYGEQVEIRERTHIVGQPAVKVFASMFIVSNP